MAGSENKDVPENEEEISGQEDVDEEESSEEEAPVVVKAKPKSKFILVRF